MIWYYHSLTHSHRQSTGTNKNREIWYECVLELIFPLYWQNPKLKFNLKFNWMEMHAKSIANDSRFSSRTLNRFRYRTVFIGLNEKSNSFPHHMLRSTCAYTTRAFHFQVTFGIEYTYRFMVCTSIRHFCTFAPAAILENN